MMASPRLVAKKTTVSKVVVRVRKLPLPTLPNMVCDAPLPKEAPISAPLPRWRSTSPVTPMAASTWTTINMDSTCINCSRTNSLRSVDPRGPTLYLVRGGTDSDKFLRHQRGASHEAAIDVRLGEKLGRVPRLDAAAIKDGEVFRHFP